MTRIAAATTVAAISCVVAGCGGERSGTGRVPDGAAVELVKPPVERGASRTRPAAPLVPTEVRHEALPSGWLPEPWRLGVAAAPRSRTLDLRWGYGCSKQEVVYVDERPGRVIIDVWSKPAVLAEDEACPAVATLAAYTITLRAPLGDRELLQHRVGPGRSSGPTGAAG